jgi:anthranilate synthase component 2
MKTVILDNYDSFTFNLVQYIGELDERPTVFRNDKITVEELDELQPDRIIISPGPGDAADERFFGVCRDVVLKLGGRIPILGVCLGHQGIILAFGGTVIRGSAPVHGKTSYIFHDEQGIFCGLPRAFEAMRYHSLIADPTTLPDCLVVTARTSDDVIMGVQHRELPIYGVQFHPESIGTPDGKQLLRNFLTLELAAV